MAEKSTTDKLASLRKGYAGRSTGTQLGHEPIHGVFGTAPRRR